MKTLYKAVEHLTYVGWQVVGYLNLKQDDLIRTSKGESILDVELLTNYQNATSLIPIYYNSMVECLIKLSSENEFSLNHIFHHDILEVNGKKYIVSINPFNKCIILINDENSIDIINIIETREDNKTYLKSNVKRMGNKYMNEWVEKLKIEKRIFITL